GGNPPAVSRPHDIAPCRSRKATNNGDGLAGRDGGRDGMLRPGTDPQVDGGSGNARLRHCGRSGEHDGCNRNRERRCSLHLRLLMVVKACDVRSARRSCSQRVQFAERQRSISVDIRASDAIWNEPGKLVPRDAARSEEHTSELQSRENLVCRPLLEKKKKQR